MLVEGYPVNNLGVLEMSDDSTEEEVTNEVSLLVENVMHHLGREGYSFIKNTKTFRERFSDWTRTCRNSCKKIHMEFGASTEGCDPKKITVPKRINEALIFFVTNQYGIPFKVTCPDPENSPSHSRVECI